VAFARPVAQPPAEPVPRPGTWSGLNWVGGGSVSQYAAEPDIPDRAEDYRPEPGGETASPLAELGAELFVLVVAGEEDPAVGGAWDAIRNVGISVVSLRLTVSGGGVPHAVRIAVGVACQYHVGRQVKVLWTRGTYQGRAGPGEGGASRPGSRLCRPGCRRLVPDARIRVDERKGDVLQKGPDAVMRRYA